MRHLGLLVMNIHVQELNVYPISNCLLFIYLILDHLLGYPNKNMEKTREKAEKYESFNCMLVLLLFPLDTETKRKYKGCPEHLYQLDSSTSDVVLKNTYVLFC